MRMIILVRKPCIEAMVKNATQHVMKTTNGFSGQVADIELMVKNATMHVMTTTDGFSVRVEDIEEMVRNATQHVISTTDGFSDDALEMKSMVKNATDSAQETSSYVREVLRESEKNFEYYIYLSGAFILVTGLISLLTAGCCQCRRSKNVLELTIDKRKVPDDQKALIEIGHELITRPASGHHIEYKITRKTNRYVIEIDSDDIVIQAMLMDAFKRFPAKEESPSVTSPLIRGDTSPLESIETQQTTDSKRNLKGETSTPIKLETKVTIVSEESVVGDKVTSL